MRDRNGLVTRDTTRDSQHPVPALPDPSRPALYMGSGEPSIHVVTYVPGAARLEWMGHNR